MRSRLQNLVLASATASIVALAPLSHARPAPEVEPAFNGLRLNEARRLLAAAPDDEPQVLYFRARLAIWDHATKHALDLASRCLEVAIAESICHEVWGEASSLELLDGGLFEQYRLARQAKAAWERAVDLDPDNLRARMLLLRYYRQAPWIAGGSKRKAKLQAKEIAGRDRLRAMEAEGLSAYFDGDYDAALTHFVNARKQVRDSFDPRYYVPLAAARIGDHATAIQAFAELIEANPEDWDGWFFLGYAKLNARPPIGVTRAALQEASDDIEPSSLRARALFAHGRMLERIGETDAGREAFAAALGVDASLVEAEHALAELD